MRNDLLADIFHKSLLTRVFEDRFVKLAMEGVVPPLLHPGAGQEVAQIAAISALKDDDPVLYAHRGTGYMIARGVSMRAMLAMQPTLSHAWCASRSRSKLVRSGAVGCMALLGCTPTYPICPHTNDGVARAWTQGPTILQGSEG